MTTYHSLQQAHKRLGLNERTARRNIALAYIRGKRAGAFSGNDYRYLISKCGDDCEPVVYQDAIYIFSKDGVCVTLYKAPRWLGQKRRDYDGKTRMRNAVRYRRMWAEEGCW